MKSDILFLFTGYGSELTLWPLYHEITSLGLQALTLDFFSDFNAKQKVFQIKGKKIVYITSSHLLFDEEIRSWYCWKQVQALSPIEIISFLKPIYSVYYPHDLCDQIQEEEETYLSLFDLVLCPDETLTKYPFIKKTRKIGYIKLAKIKKKQLSIPLFLPSNVMQHHGRGVPYFLNHYKNILKQSVVKFPVWDYTSNFEAAFREKGIKYYPAKENSVDLMQKHEVVIGEGCSSTVYEASKLGKKVIYLKDCDLDYKDIKKIYKGLEHITFTTIKEFPHLDFSNLPYGKATLQPFDMKQAIAAIFKGIQSLSYDFPVK